MLPTGLKPESFREYPPQGRALAQAHLDVLRELPLGLVPSLLAEVIGYDWKFPAEQGEIREQLEFLSARPQVEREKLVAGFTELHLSPQLEKVDWVNAPGSFIEQLTAYLWSSNQMVQFRSAADRYGRAWRVASVPQPPAMARLGVVIIGQGAAASGDPLFRKLQPHGLHFSQVDGDDGLAVLHAAVEDRARAHAAPYAHWYIDGGALRPGEHRGLSCVSYAALEPARAALLQRMEHVIQSGNGGPEALRSLLARMQPGDVGMPSEGEAAVLSRFQISLLTEGSGTQIFSTTFVQWAAREALRRAQPVTLLLRYAPRRRQAQMNEMLRASGAGAELDPEGSLVDADMGAYYTWLNMQRLAGAGQMNFVVWAENRGQAMGVGPNFPRATTSTTRATLKQILAWMS